MDNYPGLAALMSSYPAVMIFRTFAKANTRNLLYYQAEIAHLEAELDQITQLDQACGTSPRAQYATNWQVMSDSAVNGGDAIQWHIVIRLRALLEKYILDCYPSEDLD